MKYLKYLPLAIISLVLGACTSDANVEVSNEEVDALLEEGRQESNEEKRAEIYQEIDKILVEEQPSIFIRQAASAHASRAEVGNLDPGHLGKPDFRTVTLEEQQ